MDIAELPKEFKVIDKYKYLFNIIDHFSKFGISISIENKEINIILKNLKITLEYNGFTQEIGQ